MSKNLSYLAEHSPFENTRQLNEAIELHFSRCEYDLNETDRDVLLMLSRYSVKYNGVAHLKVDTIANTIGKSKRTAQRSISKLERLKIIERRSFIRQVSGGFGANLFIVLPLNDMSEVSPRGECAEPTQSSEGDVISTNEPINKSISKDVISNTYANAVDSPNVSPYRRFFNSVVQFVGQGAKSLVYRLYGVYMAQTKQLRAVYEHSDLIDVAIDAICDTFRATKRKDIRNIAGFYNGVLSNKLDDLASEVMRDAWAGLDFYGN